MEFKRIILKKGKEKSLERFHRWVFSGAIDVIPEPLSNGEWVEVYSAQGKYLATGYYQDANIAVRIVSFKPTAIDESFWINKIGSAIGIREKFGFFTDSSTNSFRLVNGEGDELPGLIIDWYAGTAVLQSHSEGIKLSAGIIAEILSRLMGSRLISVFHKSSYPHHTEEPGVYLKGESRDMEILENGLKFRINLEQGQKTGYFLDQRENRNLAQKVSGGARVLDAFCYAGGFSANALKGGAAYVDAVDINQIAIDLTTQNLEFNGFGGRYNCHNGDVLKFIQDTENIYDLVILDPPAFAKHLSSRHNAVQGYKRLNATALKKIKKNGILFTFSCSQVVDKVLFENTIIAAAIEAGRMARILYRLGQPADHPVNIFHPESEYLKGLVLQVE